MRVCLLYLPVLRIQGSPPYSCRNRDTSWLSATPRPLHTLICVRNVESSSYNPRSLEWLWCIDSPIFSKLWSSRNHEGSVSSNPRWQRACVTTFRRNLHRDDFPIPVGMQIEIQSRTGSAQSVPSTSTVEWDMEKLTTSSSPAKTAVAGTLIALPTW